MLDHLRASEILKRRLCHARLINKATRSRLQMIEVTMRNDNPVGNKQAQLSLQYRFHPTRMMYRLSSSPLAN